MKSLGHSLWQARFGIAIMAMTYALSVGVGILMVHGENRFALVYRDRLVSAAHRDDAAARANDAGAPGKAALIDSSRNLGLAG